MRKILLIATCSLLFGAWALAQQAEDQTSSPASAQPCVQTANPAATQPASMGENMGGTDMTAPEPSASLQNPSITASTTSLTTPETQTNPMIENGW